MAGKAVISNGVAGSNSYTPGNATLWGSFGGAQGDNRTNPETGTQIPFGAACTLNNLYQLADANSNGMTTTLRDNGASKSSVVSLSSGILTGQDITHSDSILFGDLVNVQQLFSGFSGFAIAADTSISSSIYAAPMGNNHEGNTVAANVTRFWDLLGGDDTAGFTPETATSGKRAKAFTLTNYSVDYNTNTLNATSTWTIRKNGTTTLNNTVSFSASSGAAIVTDITHSDTIVDNDFLYNKTTNAAGSGSATLFMTSIWATIATGATQTLAGDGFLFSPNQGGVGPNANIPCVGSSEITTRLNQVSYTPINISCTWTNLRFTLTSTGVNAAVTATGTINGSAGNQVLSFPQAASPGDYEDLTHSDSLNPTSTIQYLVNSSGTSGNFNIAQRTSQLNGSTSAGPASGAPNPFFSLGGFS